MKISGWVVILTPELRMKYKKMTRFGEKLYPEELRFSLQLR